MSTTNTSVSPPGTADGFRTARRGGQAVTAVIVAWVVFAVADRLESVGRHFLVLGVLRMALLVALLGFTAAFVAPGTRLRRWALGMAGIGAVANLVGGLGSVLTDGWSHDPFAPGAGDPPWYAFVIGLSASLFAVGSVMTGIVGRSGGWLAVAAVLGGVLYPMAFVMQGLYGHDPGDLLGHLIWIAPWLALTIGLTRVRPRQDSNLGPAD